ncbi:hypothetical protein L873DRAFT_1785235 [Choiromyces venosus 120613-1]|uniref:Mid2 domain-containing protein n=1 Tax=Choiromyces venosus 120613-1 TaxID=1336337 RepID=A0A3N4K6V4_9PEZI|nr:hypothetical protein L873DRAFT_1785235 [Choiromyces venosus 120613-1]
MSTTSFSSMLFALLLLILQSITAVSALPTITTTSAELETRQTSDSNRNRNNNNDDNNVISPNADGDTGSNKVTPGQIVGVVIGALCVVALALIFWYCFVQHQRRKRELRASEEKATAIENTKRADPSYDYARSIDARSFC